MARPATCRHHGAHPMPHPRAQTHAIAGQVAWLARRASAAGVPFGLRARSARTAHTARPHSSPAPAHMMHMS
eukprot:3608311-Prymnesium_polylepis.1